MDPETLAHAVEYTEDLFTRFLAGFDEGTRIGQADHLPNHVAWLLGHCALTMHRIAGVIDEGPLPGSDFVTGDGQAGDADRYDTESICKESIPRADASGYPSLVRGELIFRSSIARLAGAVRGASSAALGESMTWHGTPLTRGETGAACLLPQRLPCGATGRPAAGHGAAAGDTSLGEFRLGPLTGVVLQEDVPQVDPPGNAHQ